MFVCARVLLCVGLRVFFFLPFVFVCVIYIYLLTFITVVINTCVLFEHDVFHFFQPPDGFVLVFGLLSCVRRFLSPNLKSTLFGVTIWLQKSHGIVASNVNSKLLIKKRSKRC